MPSLVRQDRADGRGRPGWFAYPIGHLTLKAAPEPGAGEMMVVAVDGATDDEQQKIGWLCNIMRNWHLSGPDQA
jgi:hypothetical protein